MTSQDVRVRHGRRPARATSPKEGSRAWSLHAGFAATAFMALAAYFGAIGLIGGGLDFGPYKRVVVSRLPFHSLVLAGVALLIVVAVPMSVAAVTVLRRLRFAAASLELAGIALLAWILVEVAVVRVFSWMQPFCLVAGLVVLVLGRLARPNAG